MSLHARQLAMPVGAQGEEITWIVQRMLGENNIRSERAAALLAELRQGRRSADAVTP
jgi:hydroxymethylglutaryl-CoA reductase